MSVKVCVLREIDSLDRFYDEVARQLDLSPHFGRNLDALWDALSTDVAGPLEILWQDSDAAKRALGPDYRHIEALLRELETERSDFRFRAL